MLIEIKDLIIGDEIIVSSNSQLKYLRVLRLPSISKVINRWGNSPLYKSVKCSARQEEVNYNYTGKSGNTRSWKRKQYICTPEEHNIEIYQNLNWKSIWLIKREGE